ncbi:hypothetical protein [uncultured Hymenobacter sp.]|uniref:hypothetical protein n=1 Tax=uncultured Hymenobacter sp. TaxID=170016 RepID=UPI0035CC2DA8
MTLKIALLPLLLAVSPIASAKKAYMPLEAIASQADYIVIGEIVSADPTSYRFKVAEYIKGSGRQILTVQQFAEWTCDVRYAKAAKGQRLFLFLKKHHTALEIIDGSSGEMPIINHTVTLPYESYAYQYGKPFVPYSIALQEFKTGIKKLVSCFNIPADPNPFSTNSKAVVQLCGADEIKAFRSASKFTGWLYERIRTRYSIANK